MYYHIMPNVYCMHYYIHYHMMPNVHCIFRHKAPARSKHSIPPCLQYPLHVYTQGIHTNPSSQHMYTQNMYYMQPKCGVHCVFRHKAAAQSKHSILPWSQYAFYAYTQGIHTDTHSHICILCTSLYSVYTTYRHPVTLIERNPPPRGGFLFTMFPHQEPWVRGPPSKDLYQVLRGPPPGGVGFFRSTCIYIMYIITSYTRKMCIVCSGTRLQLAQSTAYRRRRSRVTSRVSLTLK